MAYIPTLGRFLQEDPAEYIDGSNIYSFEKASPVVGLDPAGTTDAERQLWTNMMNYLQGQNPNDPRIQQLKDLIQYNGWEEYDWNQNGGATCPQQQYNWQQEQQLRAALQNSGLNVNIATGFHVLERSQQGSDLATQAMNDLGIGHVDIYYNGVLIRVGMGGASPKGANVTNPGQQSYWDSNNYTDYPLERLPSGDGYNLEAGSGAGTDIGDATDDQIADAIENYPVSGTGGSSATNNCRNDVMDAEYGAGLHGFYPVIRGVGNYPSENLKRYTDER